MPSVPELVNVTDWLLKPDLPNRRAFLLHDETGGWLNGWNGRGY